MLQEYPLPSADPASLGFAAAPISRRDRPIRLRLVARRHPGAA
jgi:hypothetical protein